MKASRKTLVAPSDRYSEQRGCSLRLNLPDTSGSEDHQMKPADRIPFGGSENCTSAGNFYIIGMGAEAQNLWRSGGRWL
jgi:hypothetical protein